MTEVYVVPTFDPITNEFGIGPRYSNTYGTIAMAKVANKTNSATSQWFFNLADNSGNLNNQNGGFTVFGQVVNGWDVVLKITALEIVNAGSPYDTLPVRENYTGGTITELQSMKNRYYRSATSGYPALPGRASAAIRTAARVYRAIGTAIRRRGPRTIGERAVVGRVAKAGHVTAALTGATLGVPGRVFARVRGRRPLIPSSILELADVPRL